MVLKVGILQVSENSRKKVILKSTHSEVLRKEKLIHPRCYTKKNKAVAH